MEQSPIPSSDPAPLPDPATPLVASARWSGTLRLFAVLVAVLATMTLHLGSAAAQESTPAKKFVVTPTGAQVRPGPGDLSCTGSGVFYFYEATSTLTGNGVYYCPYVDLVQVVAVDANGIPLKSWRFLSSNCVCLTPELHDLATEGAWSGTSIYLADGWRKYLLAHPERFRVALRSVGFPNGAAAGPFKPASAAVGTAG